MTAPKIMLERFRDVYRPQVLTVNAVNWRWFDSGGDRSALLMLEGGLGGGESYFQFFEPLAEHARVLTPTIPLQVSKVSEAVEGLLAIMDGLQIDRFHLFGHSQGGYLAQCLLRARPARIASATLSATCLPSERRARRIDRQLRLVRYLPSPLLRFAAAAQVLRIAATDLAGLTLEERLFWKAYLTEGVGIQEVRRQIESTAKLQIDYHRRARFKVSDLAEWAGQMIIVTFGRDQLIDGDDAVSLMSTYPTAIHVDFADSGHLGIISKAPAIVALLAKQVCDTL